MLAALIFSGCACEQPRRIPRRTATPAPTLRVRVAGPEVPDIRVKLGDDALALSVAVAGPWHLMVDGREVAGGQTLDWTDVRIDRGQVVFGALVQVGGAVELRGDLDGSVWVHQAAGGKDREGGYRGRLRIAPTKAGALRVINTLPVESYVAGVVALEMYKKWHVEAFKAQAVAARTYALLDHNQRARYDYDVLDTTGSQVYGGCAAETATAWEAVRETWSVVATYRGPTGKPTLLKCYYHSTCGGETADAEAVFGGPVPPALAGGVKCEYCRPSSKYRWADVVILKKDASDALARSGDPALAAVAPLRAAAVVSRSSAGGRVEEIRLVGGRNQEAVVTANRFRLLVGAVRVPSTWFDLQDAGDRLVLKNGKGFGHGVGLCQWGAQYLADHGKTGEEILRYYYPKVELVRAY